MLASSVSLHISRQMDFKSEISHNLYSETFFFSCYQDSVASQEATAAR